MEFNWAASEYRDVINEYLGYRSERRPRGAVKGLAESLRCHSTFIAQVLSGRAEFSLEQGIQICRHFQFSGEEEDFFLTMLMRDRASTKPLREYFQKKLDFTMELKKDLKAQVSPSQDLSAIFEAEYFGNWLYQTAHALLQIKKFQSPEALVAILGGDLKEIKSILNRLKVMGLVTQEGSAWKSTQASLHLSKDSPFIRSLHSTWKTKILSDLQTRVAPQGTRYSGIITINEKDFQKVRDILIRAIGDIRKVVVETEPENAYVLSMDCYEMFS